jgi:hypothetical protein
MKLVVSVFAFLVVEHEFTSQMAIHKRGLCGGKEIVVEQKPSKSQP